MARSARAGSPSLRQKSMARCETQHLVKIGQFSDRSSSWCWVRHVCGYIFGGTLHSFGGGNPRVELGRSVSQVHTSSSSLSHDVIDGDLAARPRPLCLCAFYTMMDATSWLLSLRAAAASQKQQRWRRGGFAFSRPPERALAA